MQKRGKWHATLPLMAAIVLLGLLAVPATRWLVRTQMSSGFFSPQEYVWTMQMLGMKENSPPVDIAAIHDKLRAAVVRHTGEYNYALAGAILMPTHTEAWKTQDVVASLRSLRERYPQEPSLYAHILRFGSSGEIRTGRSQEEDQVTDRSLPARPYTSNEPDTTKLWEYIEAAEKGIELEPDNAYFYAMRAIAHFGLRQDEEALEDMHRAAICTRYEDYSSDEASARLDLLKEAFGEQSGLAEMTQAASILFPQYARLKSATRMAVYHAIAFEQSGNFNKGIAIREDVMRFGSLLRRHSRSYIGTLVGIALVNIGRTRPGGAYSNIDTEAAITLRSESADSEQIKEQRAQHKLEIFTKFLEEHDQSALAEWTQNEYEKGKETRAVGMAGMDDHIFDSKQFARLTGLWIASVTTLRNAIWMLLLGGLALFLTRRHAPPIKGAGFIFLGGCAAAMAFMFLNQPMAWYFGSLLSTMNGMMGNEKSVDLSALFKGVTLFGAMAVPVLTLIVAGVVSLCCRVPVTLGILRAFRGLGLPVACVLLLLFSGATLVTAREEGRVKQELRQMIQHEGHYLAEHTGHAWPEN